MVIDPDPILVGMLIALLLFFFFIYLLVRRTVVGFREGFGDGYDRD